MTDRYYSAYDEVEKTWDVYESDGGYECSQYYDVFQFACATKDDADDAVMLLNKLHKKASQ